MNPNSLLDLAFGDDGNAVDNNHLPEAQYLPALEKQKELEALLRQQQVGRLYGGVFKNSSFFYCISSHSYIGATAAIATATATAAAVLWLDASTSYSTTQCSK
jgi:hypothetical protein